MNMYFNIIDDVLCLTFKVWGNNIAVKLRKNEKNRFCIHQVNIFVRLNRKGFDSISLRYKVINKF